MPSHPIVDAQPIHQPADHVLLQRKLAEFAQLGLVVGRRAQDGEPLDEGIGAEVVGPGLRDGGRHDVVDVQPGHRELPALDGDDRSTRWFCAVRGRRSAAATCSIAI